MTFALEVFTSMVCPAFIGLAIGYIGSDLYRAWRRR